MGWGTGDPAGNCQQSPVGKPTSPDGSSSMPGSLSKGSESGAQAGATGCEPAGLAAKERELRLAAATGWDVLEWS